MSLEEFNTEIIEQYFRDGKKVPEFEDSLMETLFSDQKFDLILSLLHRGFILTFRIKYWILRSGDLRLYQYLIDHGMQVDQNMKMAAVISGNLATVKHVFKRPEKSNRREYLELAASQGHIEIVKWLLEFGCNPKLFYGVFTSALKTGHIDICQYVVEKDATFLQHYKWDYNGTEPLISIQYLHKIHPIQLGELAIDSLEYERMDILEWINSQRPYMEIIEETLALEPKFAWLTSSEKSLLRTGIKKEDSKFIELVIKYNQDFLDELDLKHSQCQNISVNFLDYLHSKIPINLHKFVDTAAKVNRIDLLKWANSKGASLKYVRLGYLIENKNWEMFEYLLEGGVSYTLFELEEWMQRDVS